MKRGAKGGHQCAVLPSALPDGMSYSETVFDPLWTLAQDMNFLIHYHVKVGQGRDRVAARLKVVTKLEQGRRSVTAASTWPASPKIIERRFKGFRTRLSRNGSEKIAPNFYGVA